METNTAGTDPAEVRVPAKNVVAMAGWARLLVPSVCDLWFVLLVLALTWGPLAKGLLGDGGIGWHIRTGQLIVSGHTIPRVDPFSSTMHGQAWFAWEWLYDAAISAIHHWTGLNGVAFSSALVIALTFTIVFRMMLARHANLVPAAGMLLLTVAASTIHVFARPHVLSWLLSVIWFGILDRFEANGETRQLLWLPVLTLLWVNVHGGFVVGFILLVIFFVGALANWLAARNQQDRGAALLRIQGLGLAGILSFAGTFANPYGYKLHLHIYRYLTDRFLMDHIDEFLSPNFHGLAQKCFAGILLLAVMATWATRKRVGLTYLFVMLFAMYAGLYAARNIPVSSMLLGLIVAPQLSVWLKEMAGSREIAERIRRLAARIDNFGTRMATLDSNMRGHLWPALTVLLGLWMCGHGGRLGGAQMLEARFDEARFPVQATDFLERSGNREPIFCPDKWGGYLIYRLYPQTLVAVDDRHDLYGAEFLMRYLKIVHGEPGWQEALDEMGTRLALLPKESALASLLAESGHWKTLYRDETAILFLRSEGGAVR